MNPAMVADDDIVFNAVEVIREMEEEMQKASAKLGFEKAAHLRDQIVELQKRAGLNQEKPGGKGPVAYQFSKKGKGRGK